MLALLHRFAPRLGLLLILALALGGFLFLFDLFVGLIATGPKDLLAENTTVGPTTEIPSGARFITFLAAGIFLALGAGALLLLWRRLKDGGEQQRRWLVALGALPAVALLGLGAYLALSGSLAPSLPYGTAPYSHHQVDMGGIQPLGLALLAAFVLSVVFVGITKPRLLPVPLGLWLLAGLIFGLFGSNALHGLNLFGHPTTLQTTPAYASAVDRYRQPEPAPVPVPVSVTETPPPQSEPVTAESVLRDLRFGDAWARESAAKLLEESGAEIIGLETGGSLIRWGELRYWVPNVTTRRAARPDLEPVFRVSGAVDTAYLRTAVGDTYADGGWTQLDPVALPYQASARVRPLVEELASAPPEFVAPDPASALLAWGRTGSDNELRVNEITVSPHGESGHIPAGVLPISLDLDVVQADGELRPFSVTFASEFAWDSYSWISGILEFSEEELGEARAANDSAYTQLPEDLPQRVRLLAQEITREYDGPYRKARAIEEYLKDKYDYAFAGVATVPVPSGRDPVDWFLFDERKGTCGQFSSAFVLLARSVGIPARVVSGWYIGPVGVEQTVRSNQAHQWAEVALEGPGWTTFDPTAEGAAPFRVPSRRVWRAELDRLLQELAEATEGTQRAEAIAELIRLGEKAPIPLNPATSPLSLALESDELGFVRAAAARALGALGGSSGLKPLARALAEDKHFPVRVAAAQALGELERREAISPLTQALHDPAPQVRDAAEEALEKLGAKITPLENGGHLASLDGATRGMSAGPTTRQAAQPAHTPVFRVEGAGSTRYLRTGVGETYGDGSWSPGTLAELPYPAHQEVRRLVASQLPSRRDRRVALLTWPHEDVRVDSRQDHIRLSPQAPAGEIPGGVLPFSMHARSIHTSGYYRPLSATFRSGQGLSLFSWTSRVPLFTEGQLVRYATVSDLSYTQLPPNLPPRVRRLAHEITQGHVGPYRQAKAIEAYLRANYTYVFAKPDDKPIPAGRDPVDWFLFESREGTCGQFSSAFVLLARSVGIPARVVSGWTVSPVKDRQTVYADQAHQWAEVAFAELGWVTFEPTAAGGAPSRTPDFGDGPRPQALAPELEAALEAAQRGDRSAVRDLGEQLGLLGGNGSPDLEQAAELLSDNRPGARESAAQVLQALGAAVTPLENGGSLLNWGGRSSWVGGATTQQARQLPASPVFNVKGDAGTGYLRTGTGDTYSNGAWTQLDPLELPYEEDANLPVLVSSNLNAASQRPESALLAWPKHGYDAGSGRDFITVSAHPQVGSIPAQGLPISLHPEQISTDGSYRPFSVTFAANGDLEEYEWVAQVPEISQEQLARAQTVADPTYTQLPDDLPQYIYSLAVDITREHASPYQKAKAIETFLRTKYTYAYADADEGGPPPGRDPVDWFLFNSRKGTCGQFSSAFVVLARSVRIPARVVTGWAVGQRGESRTVYSDQAHQWAEVAFQGLGWLTFEPTAAGGAPSRAEGQGSSPSSTIGQPLGGRTGGGSGSGGATVPPQAPQVPAIQATATQITQWPERTLRGMPFTIGGSVAAESGDRLDNMEVEVFINTKKEKGGTKVGSGFTQRGQFLLEIELPEGFARGSYQLIAHTLARPGYAESWSDPEIGVYSGTGLEFSGPTEIAVDVPAEFRGRLSEETGGPVASKEVQVKVDGQGLPPLTTDAQGQFSFSNTFGDAGEHLVEVEFAETDFMLGNAARLDVVATMPSSLEIVAPNQVRVGEEFQISATLRDQRGDALEQQSVELTLGGVPLDHATTDSQGAVSLAHSISRPGTDRIEASFAGDGFIEASSSSFSLKATEPVLMEVSGDPVARVGAPYQLTGRLTGAQGQPLPDLSLTVEVAGQPRSTHSTDAQGAFSWEATFDAATEATAKIAFPGTDQLEPSQTLWPISVGVPEIVVELLEPVARGDTLSLRGVVVIGSQVGTNTQITVDGEQAVRSNAAGSFILRHPVPPDAALGELALELAAPELDAATTATVTVKSTTSVVVTPLERVRLGRPLPLEARLLDDRGSGIPNAVVRYGEAAAVTTGPDGVATFTVTTPGEEESLAAVPLTLRFDGDDSNLPLTYFVGLPVSPVGFNWLLWVGLPLLLVVGLAGGYRGGRLGLALPIPRLGRVNPLASAAVGSTFGSRAAAASGEGRELVAPQLEISFPGRESEEEKVWIVGENVSLQCALTGGPELPLARANLELEWGDAGETRRLRTDREGRCLATWTGDARGIYRVTARFAGNRDYLPVTAGAEFRLRGPAPTQLEIDFLKPAADLPDIWGIGEQVQMEFTLVDDEGQGVAGRAVQVTMGEPPQLVDVVTDGRGQGRTEWNAAIPGVYQASVEFVGDEDYLPSSGIREFELVEFREEVVRRYNLFLDWARERSSGIEEQTTPREVESLVVGSGVPLDQRALEEVISRFEEADYSVHEIDRRRFEAMYRACRRILGA